MRDIISKWSPEQLTVNTRTRAGCDLKLNEPKQIIVLLFKCPFILLTGDGMDGIRGKFPVWPLDGVTAPVI